MERITQDTPKGASLILGDPKTDEEAREQVRIRFMDALNILAAYERTGLTPEEVAALVKAESDKIFSAIDTMILRANELNRISENNDVSPIEAGRASWERRGILSSLKTITETTGIIQFEDLFECGNEAAEAALREGDK